MATNTRARITLLALGLSTLVSTVEAASARPGGAIDVFRARHHCVATADRLTLQRPDANGPSTATLRHVGSGANATITWDADATLADWPAGLPVGDGDTLQVLVAGSPASNKLTVHVVPEQMTSPAQVAVWMARMGCGAQARSLLARR